VWGRQASLLLSGACCRVGGGVFLLRNFFMPVSVVFLAGGGVAGWITKPEIVLRLSVVGVWGFGMLLGPEKTFCRLVGLFSCGGRVRPWAV